MADPHARMLELAVGLAADAGAIAFDPATPKNAAHKPDGSLLTDADRRAQNHILRAIARAYPDHAVLAEETVARPEAHSPLRESEYVWVVDPLDGTRNFVAGFPCVATSIAVLQHGQPVVGVIREHNLGRTYTAVAGGGAYRGDRRLRPHATDQATGPGGDMLVGFASSKDRFTVGVVQHWARQPGLVLRNTGSTAFQLALVAEGVMSAAFGKRVRLWDVAAGALLVVEAGGRITRPDGRPMVPFDLSGDLTAEFPYLAAGTQAYERVAGTIREVRSAVAEP